MSTRKIIFSTGAVAAAWSSMALAGSEPYFNPLTQSGVVAEPNSVPETESPWLVPPGLSQVSLMNMSEVEADVTQSIQRVDAGTSASMFDMIAYDPSGNYFFIPHETPFGAGLSRYDIRNDKTELLFAGDQGSVVEPCEPDTSNPPDPAFACAAWDYDYAAFDPARWTPNGTVIVAEEWDGLGRVVEVLNPLGPAPADPSAAVLEEGVDYRVWESIAKVSHEGINFSVKSPKRIVYYIDEWNSGSIYKLVLGKYGDYAGGGQTFVLSVDGFLPSGGDPAANWDEAPNDTATRFGVATWVPITDPQGNPLPGVTNPFRNGPTNDPRESADTRGGRPAADDVGGTPYGRPEDMEIGLLPNGNEVLYVTVTSEQSVISIEILNSTRAMVRQFVTADTPTNLGFPATTATINSPDNLAQDALGNLFIIEDAPNSSSTGGDIWFARDTNNDGIAESIDLFMTLQVAGSESTGMIFHPKKPNVFVVAVQHPTSTDLAEVPDGLGDAVWEFDLSTVTPPLCGEGRQTSEFNIVIGRWIQTCTDDTRFNTVVGSR